MERFVYTGQPSRVVFGSGSFASLGEEVARLGLRRVLVLSTPEQRASAERVAADLGGLAAGVFDRATMHVPVPVADGAAAEAGRLGADGCVAIGGGSTIGLGKAVALRHGLPVVAVPTTYSGSEMTPIWGLTEDGAKRTGRDSRVLPRTIIYDPDLTLGLPVGMSSSSGLNAIAHAVEALYAPDGNPVVALMAEEGIRSLALALPAIASAPGDPGARSAALYGSWLCGTVLGQVTMSLHHKLCHTLGGSLDLPHAETHAVVLPHAAAFNRSAAPAAMRAVARALGAAEAATGLWDLADGLDVPTSLAALGVAEEQLEAVADQALLNPYWNPRPLERTAIRSLLQDAWSGARPAARTPA